jgi:hypothetical protein
MAESTAEVGKIHNHTSQPIPQTASIIVIGEALNRYVMDMFSQTGKSADTYKHLSCLPLAKFEVLY